jgi:hypothetical protein
MKKFFTSLLLLILAPGLCFGAVAFDATGANNGNFVNSLTVNITVGSGSNRFLALCIGSSMGSDAVTGVTDNGNAMTRQAASTFGNPVGVWMYTIANPASGAHSIVVSLGSLHDLGAIASSFSGVDQATPVDGNGGGGPNGFQNSPRSDNITVSAGGMAYDCLNSNGNTDTYTAGGSQTDTANQQNDGSSKTAASYLVGASAMSWSWPGGQHNVSHGIIAIKAAGGASPCMMNLLGVGC